MRYHHVSLPFYSDFIEVEAVRLGVLVIKLLVSRCFFQKSFYPLELDSRGVFCTNSKNCATKSKKRAKGTVNKTEEY